MSSSYKSYLSYLKNAFLLPLKDGFTPLPIVFIAGRLVSASRSPYSITHYANRHFLKKTPPLKTCCPPQRVKSTPCSMD